jgi:hypothetical protein
MTGQRMYTFLLGNKLRAFCTIFVAAICMAILNSPYTHYPIYDMEVFRHVGMNIYKGYVPYKDVFDHKPPLVYFLAAAVYPLGIWGNWFLGVFCAALAAYCLWLLSVFYKFKYTWVLPLVLLGLLFWQKEFIGRYFDTRYFTTIFLCMLLYMVLVKTNKWFVVKGMLVAFIFLTQLNEILIALLFIALNVRLLYHESLQEVFKLIVLTLVGFVIIIALLFMYFAYHNALPDLYFSVIKFNTTYFVKSVPFAIYIAGMQQLFAKSFIPKFFALLTLVFAGSFFLKNHKFTIDKIRWVTILVVIASVFNIGLTGYYWLYYTYHLIIPCILMLLCIINRIETLSKYVTLSVFGIIILSVIARRAMITDAFETFKKYGLAMAYNERYKNFEQEVEVLANKPNGLLVLNDVPALSLANNNGIRVNTKWILSYFWDESINKHIQFDTSGNIFNNELLLPLRVHKPTYIIYIKGTELSDDRLRPDVRKQWQQFLDSNYIYHKAAYWDTGIVMYKLRN